MTRRAEADCVESHLTRGAWIEIFDKYVLYIPQAPSHLTRGAWIEISAQYPRSDICKSRTSHEVRGLKFVSIYRT